jgi:Tol biopolymer transport system component
METSKRKGCRRLLGVAFLAGLVLLCDISDAAPNVKLSGVMPPSGDIIEFKVSPDSRYAVYLADQNSDGIFELYSVSLGGGSPIRLNPSLTIGKNVIEYQISPDSAHVVYWADQDTNGVNELYSAPIAGPAGSGMKLNGALPPGGGVGGFRISPDSTRVVYRADQQTDQVWELYSIAIGGPTGSGIKVNGSLVLGGNVLPIYQISLDSSRVVYLADQTTDGVFELYSVPIGGPAGTDTKLNGVLTAGGNVGDFQISPDSARVIYRADQNTDNVAEIYSVAISGPTGSEIKLNKNLTAGGGVYEFQIGPDSSRVVYRADQDADEVFELYSVPLAGPSNTGVKINGPLVADGDVNTLNGVFQISADSRWVVYMADGDNPGDEELYSVPIAGPGLSVVKLNGPLTPNGDVLKFKVSPAGDRVIYFADQTTVGVYELFSAPIRGPAGSAVKLNGVLVEGGDVDENFQISPNNSFVAYRADQETEGQFELYRVPLGGPATSGVKLNDPIQPAGDVSIFDNSYQISPDSKRVIYMADQETEEVIELYMTSIYYLLHLPLILRQG